MTVQPYAIQMEVSVNLDVKDNPVITADPEDMNIIFNNLISNAVKYNNFGGKVNISIEGKDDNVKIIVTDTGIGISEEDKENLFTEFMRVKSERTKNITGSGLGLSIVRKVVELYNGKINVESHLGSGSIFIVTLPRKPVTKI
jgi:signal transduction histidine kinase